MALTDNSLQLLTPKSGLVPKWLAHDFAGLVPLGLSYSRGQQGLEACPWHVDPHSIHLQWRAQAPEPTLWGECSSLLLSLPGATGWAVSPHASCLQVPTPGLQNMIVFEAKISKEMIKLI